MRRQLRRGRWRTTTWGIAAVIVVAQVTGVRLVRVTGESMAPRIHAGDVAITSMLGARSAREGSILLFARQQDRMLLLHRVVALTDRGRVTKGDASLAADSDRVSDAAVQGRLVALIPLSAIGELDALSGALFRGVATAVASAAGATFTLRRPLELSVTSGDGANVTVESIATSGVDTAGRLLPGATKTWSLLLVPCTSGGSSGCSSAVQQLRLDSSRFGLLMAGADRPLARALRLETRCKDVAAPSAPWSTASDIFTSEWSSLTAATGTLVTLPAGGNALRCELRATLLGSLVAVSRIISLPLTWGT